MHFASRVVGNFGATLSHFTDPGDEDEISRGYDVVAADQTPSSTEVDLTPATEDGPGAADEQEMRLYGRGWHGSVDEEVEFSHNPFQAGLEIEMQARTRLTGPGQSREEGGEQAVYL